VTDDFEYALDSWGNWDEYHHEFQKFEREAHTLILMPLHAAISHLKQEAEAEDQKLEPKLSESRGEEAEHYANLQQGNWEYFSDQERFLRNMALVGLLSRLIHSLRGMARTAESINPQVGKYAGEGELAKLWTEFTERFNFDFSDLQEEINYLDRLRLVRNQIVHDGGEANKMKKLGESKILPDGTFDMFDTKFSDKFPEFVQGSDSSAEVEVSEAQLDLGIEHSVKIVRWISKQLRAKELEVRNAGHP
jgi:hypothetical protein